ncbi:hypothetical protein VTK56DRAFT_2232 [Thermocarpiscus australiensis]
MPHFLSVFYFSNQSRRATVYTRRNPRRPRPVFRPRPLPLPLHPERRGKRICNDVKAKPDAESSDQDCPADGWCYGTLLYYIGSGDLAGSLTATAITLLSTESELLTSTIESYGSPPWNVGFPVRYQRHCYLTYCLVAIQNPGCCCRIGKELCL